MSMCSASDRCRRHPRPPAAGLLEELPLGRPNGLTGHEGAECNLYWVRL